MITAREAKSKSSVINGTSKYMAEIEKEINQSIERGENTAFITHDITEETGEELCHTIVSKLAELGYRVEFIYAIPPLCPDNRWDYNYNSGKIIIRW